MILLIAIVLGALVGAAASGEAGALAGALFGWLIVRSLRQQREIEALRKRAEAPRVARGAARCAHRERASTEREHRRRDSGSGRRDRSDARRDRPSRVPPPTAVTPPSAPPRRRHARDAATAPKIAGDGTRAAPPRDLLAPIRRWLFGGNTIVKAGVGILFVGLAFLAKYASEHVQLPIEYRLAAIAAAAVVLLGFGWRLRLSRPDYAQVLQGGAVAVLYLTLFAAFRFYDVIGAMPAFVLMVAVAALAAALAVLQDARALAVIGALGGFATPLIVSTGSDNYVALFTYYFVLDLGIAAVAWSKTWRPLNLIGFVATFIVATAWGVLKYRPEDYATSQAFLIAFFLLFVVILVLPARRLGRAAPAAGVAAPQRDAWVNSSLLFGLPTVTFALEYGLVRGTPYGAALAALVLAGFYVMLATWMRRRPELGITFDATLAIATIFLTLVIPFALDERSTAGAWTLEGAGLVWIGFRQQRGLPRLFGYLLLGLAGLAMLLGHAAPRRADAGLQRLSLQRPDGRRGLARRRLLRPSRRPRRRAQARRGSVRDAADRVGDGLVRRRPRRSRSMRSCRCGCVLAAALAAASAVARCTRRSDAASTGPRSPGRRSRTRRSSSSPPRSTPQLLANPFADGGWWAWPIAFAAHALVLAPRRAVLAEARRRTRCTRSARSRSRSSARCSAASLTAPWGDFASAWPWLGWLVAPAAMLLLLPRPATARVWPVRMLPEAYRSSAAAVLAAGLWLWTLVANVASDGSAAPLPYLPFLNPLDVGIGIALAATLLWLKHVDRVAPWSLAMAAGAGFVWLNAILVRSFHHYAGVPYHFDAWLDSLAVQTGITLLWTAIALVTMWLASTRSAREPWFVGAALLAAVVLKLVLVDLSGSLTRIVSFIGVGVLMLVIAYVAPLPTKEVRHVAT